MLEHIQLQGTYQEIGNQLGQLRKDDIRTYVDHIKASNFYKLVQDFLNTEEGAALHKQLHETCLAYCIDYVNELHGMAEGAGVSFNDIYIINIVPELAAAIHIVPDGSHGVNYDSVFGGCTNVSFETQNKEVYLVHTEDIDPFLKDKAILLTASIHNEQEEEIEKWTEYVIPGDVPGSKFGITSSGLMFAHNNIYQKGVNTHGIPRRFLSRSLLKAKEVRHVREILSKAPGISSAYSFLFLQLSSDDKPINYCVFETIGVDNEVVVSEFHPTGVYHHCNMLQHLSHECHPEESSVHRAAVISQYINRREVRTPDDLLKIVSNTKDTVFPVHRTGQHPDYLATGATGLFDLQRGTLSIYSQKPESTCPDLVLHIKDL